MLVRSTMQLICMDIWALCIYERHANAKFEAVHLWDFGLGLVAIKAADNFGYELGPMPKN